MYFPYLYGRRSELLALRSASNKYLSASKVMPVIEPVILKSGDIVRCLEDIGKKSQQAIVITNPFQGELKGGANTQWKSDVATVLTKHLSLVPGFLCRPNVSLTNVQAFLKKYSGRDVALLYFNSGLSDSEMKILVAADDVRFHISLQGKMSSVQRELLPKTKAVTIVDHFNKQERNADYSGAEHFTDNHKNYGSTAAGFGDYTVTGSEMKIGGGPPGAVAIHITYKVAANDDIWVEHFVSDETDVKSGTPAGKYLEALEKFVDEHDGREDEFGLNPALIDYFDDSNNHHFPGLGKNKERQIHHHIALMHDVLIGKI